MTPRDALRLGTRGSATVLGRARDIGQITPGYCANLALFKINSLSFTDSAVHDPVGALLLCASAQANHVVVNGRVVVDAGHLVTVDLPVLIEQHNRLAAQLVRSAGA
jgi:cytosine/adenosine deaminase-related metal-dependent hydrolase